MAVEFPTPSIVLYIRYLLCCVCSYQPDHNGDCIMRLNVSTLLVLILYTSTACSGMGLDTPSPSPQILAVGITPTINSILEEQVAFCNQENPGVEIVLKIGPQHTLDPNQLNIIFGILNDEEDGSDFAYQIGLLEIVLITHPDSVNETLTMASVQDAYTSIESSESSFFVWTYPENHELRLLFDKSYLEGSGISPFVRVAPNPGEMIEAVDSMPKSIGYVPKHSLIDGLNTLPLIPDQQAALTKPLIAFTRVEPRGLTKDFLKCMQGYSP